MKNYPVLKPKLPTFDKYEGYLKKIDETCVYSNFGQLNYSLESRIAEFANINNNQITTTSNATSGIIFALNAIKKDGRKFCIMPSWTFIGTASAVTGAGLEPLFVDVNEDSWVIDEKEIKTTLEKYQNDIAAIVVVAPFGNIVNLISWEKFSKKYDIPIVVDAATCFDGFVMKNLEEINDIPVVISTHATKIFSTGEGGLILSKDEELIKKIRSISNFGIHGESKGLRSVKLAGINAKLSEFNAAIGLGFLDIWEEYIEKYQKVIDYYLKSLKKNKIKYFYPENSISTTLSLISEDCCELEKHLNSKGISTKKWWDTGCHETEYCKNFKRTELEVTKRLAKKTIGIPLFKEMTEEEIDYIVNNINKYHD